MSDVFLSYAQEDAAIARRLGEMFEKNNLTVFHDREALVAGTNVAPKIFEAIEDAAVVLVLLSKRAKRSRWVEEELAFALKQSHIVIPILLDSEAKENWIWPLVADRMVVIFEPNTRLEELVRSVKSSVESSKSREKISVVSAGISLDKEARKMASQTPLDLDEIYKIHRTYLMHEDELIHQRTIVLITIQSFLLATFGFTYQKKYEIAEKLFSHSKSSLSALGTITDEYNGFLFILALVGAATSYIAWRSIRAAANAIKALEGNWLNVTSGHPPAHLPGITGGGNAKSNRDGDTLAILTPLFLLILWILILLVLLVLFKVAIVIK